MADYIELPVETDAQALQDDAIEYLEGQVPGWTASPGNLETWIIEAVGRMAAEVATITAQVPTTIFRFLGNDLANLPPIDAASAIAATTWTLTDTLGHTIPAGTYISIADLAFEVQADVVVAPGSSATAAGGVIVVAVEPGAAANGLTSPVEPVDALAWVNTITVVGSTSGGADAEADAAYLNRLANELQLLAPRPIIPRDFETLAKRISGVDRALALDGYNPANSTFNNDRMVAIAVVDAAGAALSTTIKNQVDALLQAQREVNFIVNVIDPTPTTINVTFTAVAYPDFDPVAVQANVVAALQDYLSPANWGQPPYGEDRRWLIESKVRYLEVAQVVNNVAGVNYVSALTVNSGSADVTLTGAAPLPQVGTVTGTVS